MPARPGIYRLQLRAIDQAGNPSPPSQAFEIRIRYIELAKHVIRARTGGRIIADVSTDASLYNWRIGSRHGRVRKRHLVLAAGPPGTYQLVVSERGHSAKATVAVGP